MSEYMRALKLQKENFTDDALSLFNELLQTELLYEVIFICVSLFDRIYIDKNQR